MMTTYVPRTVRKIEAGHSPSQPPPSPIPIEDFRPEGAYVLLGPSGAGKTTTFEKEADAQQGLYVTARDFNTFEDRPEWHDTTLFIDGLDETRAGQADGRTPFDEIRKKLEKLGHPRFRLSCREADWFGITDSERLKLVSPSGKLTVLRMNPLSDEDVQTILHDNFGIRNSKNFIDEARIRGVYGLLTIPQSLQMLKLAVRKSDDWPETRLKTFEMACKTLVAEHNKEHEVANMNAFDIRELLAASGKVFALQLLTGAAGFRLPGAESGNGLIAFEQIPGQDRHIYHRCLQSKLFESPVHGQVVPIHREVAEFMAGRYLASLVNDCNLSVGRILSLVIGHDDMVMSELRGLIAWLAAQACQAQTEIILRDPIGLIMYGDASHFSVDKKQLLLDRLMMKVEQDSRTITSMDSLSSRLGELITADMAYDLQQRLKDLSHCESRQAFNVILLKAINHSVPLVGMDETLMRMVRDNTLWLDIRIYALVALKRYRESNCGLYKDFKMLADDIFAGRVQDPSDALLNYLLGILYPDIISEKEIVKYLKVPTIWKYNVDHRLFWICLLPSISTPEQLTEILDQLVQRHDQLSQTGQIEISLNRFFSEVASTLLVKLIELLGEEIDLNSLFRWLSLSTLDKNVDDPSSAIRSWLEDHPTAWKSLLTMGVSHCANLPNNSEFSEFGYCMRRKKIIRLLNSAPPPDFGLWCIEQAIAAEDQRVLRWFLEEVAGCMQSCLGNEGLSHDVVMKRLSKHPKLGDIYNEVRKNLELPAHPKSIIFGEEPTSHQCTESPDWYEHVKPYQAEFRKNQTPLNLLYQLALVYLGGYSNIQGDTPKARLSKLLRDDDSLVGEILTGFRIATERDDLPSYKEILQLDVRNLRHNLSYPIMAGLEDISDDEELNELFAKERIVRLALAIHFTVPVWPSMRVPADRPPFWFAWLLTNRPEAVAEVLVKFALAKLRNRKEATSTLYHLAYSESHEEVARLATMPLLEKFPVQCTSEQLSNLNYLLLSANKYCHLDTFLKLIDTKLVQSGMNIAQHIHWLTAGLYLSPENYAEKLESYVTGKERRIRFLAEAVSGRLQLPDSMQPYQSVTLLRLLIQLIGTSYRPYSTDNASEEGSLYSFEMSAADKVREYIYQLATISSPKATDAIQKMRSEENLRPWHSYLDDAAYRQKAVRREAEFQYCDLDQVLATLDGKSPANAIDLAELAYEKLKQLANDIHHGNFDGWRQYWNVDNHSRPQTPRPEKACRDSLAGHLKPRLEPYGIDVSREGIYVNESRADIRVAYQGFNVPVEIKKSCDRNLWSAIQTQLIDKYAIDPEADGHGIYLVLWFGNSKHCRLTPPKSGGIPVSPEELEERLKLLLPPENFKIKVCVIDVAKPNP